jgi:hypothetical protein
LFDDFNFFKLIISLFLCDKFRKKPQIVIKDTIGNQPSAFIPDILLVFAFETQFIEIGECDGSFELMIIFAAIEGLMDILAQWRRVNVIEQKQTFDDIVIFPKGLFALIGSIV